MAVNQSPTFKVGDGMVTNNVIITGGLGFSSISRPNIWVTSNQHFLVEGVIYVGDIYAWNGSYQNAWMSYNSDGSVNSTFGNNGSLFTEPLFSTKMLPNGKIVGVNGNTGLLGRYNPDGSLDTSFGNGGWAPKSNDTNSGNSDYFLRYAQSHDIAVQADGKIILIGTGPSSPGVVSLTLVVSRYNANGSLDTSFSGDGILPLISNAPGIRQVTFQLDGKILVAAADFGNQRLSLLRINSDGSLDNTFANPFIYKDYGSKTFDLIQQADGKIILASNEWNSTTFLNEVVLRRYDVNGNPDPIFGTNGVVTSIANGEDVVLQADGKILVAGNLGGQFTLTRYNSDGSLDNSFDGDGMVSAPLGGIENTAYSVTLQADQKILVTGLHVDSFGGGRPTTGEFVIVRYNPNGSLDATFDPVNTLNGTSTYIENTTPVVLDNTVQIYDAELALLNSGNGNYNGASITLVRQGGANAQDVFSGIGNFSFSGGNAIFAGVNIGTVTSTNGSLAITFNANATQARVNDALSSIAYANSSDTPPASVVINWTLNDGNTGAQGTGGAQNTVGSTVVNITAVNDAPSFALTDGYVFTNFPNIGIYSRSSSEALSLQPNGQILLAGSNGYDLSLVRYNTNGTLDTSFDGHGKVITNFGDFGGAYRGSANSLVVQPDGKTILAGTAGSIARYNTDGSLDTSFSADGKVLDTLLPQGTIESILLQADGKILISGGVDVGASGSRFNVVRYNSNGSLDTTFGTNGLASTYISFEDRVAEAVLQADGKILVVGTSLVGGASRDFALVRYNSNSTLDTSFDVDGKVTTAVGTLDDYANSVAFQTDGKIVVGGTSDFNFALARYNTNGSLDTSFSGDGKLSLDLGKSDSIS